MNPNLSAERPRTVLASLNQALHGMMGADPRVVVLGEDLLDPYGGAFKVTKGLSTRFPDRVLTMPISEAAIVGLANGMAMRGLRPIAEIMFGDFLMLAGDQLVNHAAKFRWMGSDQFSVPMVVRAPMGGRRGYGPTHSQCLEKHFLGVPGLWVVAPHLLGDPGALLRQATLECDDPVLFVESKTCYGEPLQTDITDLARQSFADVASPFPTTLSRHAAPADGLLCCYGGMASYCLDAVRQLRDQEGLCLDLAVFTQLSPTPVSHLTWLLRERRPKLCFYAEEGSAMGGWSAEVMAQVEELRAADSGLPAIRHQRIGARHIPVPSSRELETQALPQTADIVQHVVNCF